MFLWHRIVVAWNKRSKEGTLVQWGDGNQTYMNPGVPEANISGIKSAALRLDPHMLEGIAITGFYGSPAQEQPV